MDLRSTKRDTTAGIRPDQLTHESDDEKISVDKTSSGGSDTIVPEVLGSENDETIINNESHRSLKDNLRLTPPPTTLKNTDTSQNIKFQSTFLVICPQGHVI